MTAARSRPSGVTFRAAFVRCAIVALVIASSGCMPQVLHGPHVDPGTSGVISLGMGRNRAFCDDDCNDGLRFLPTMYIGGRHGFATHEGGLASSLGIQVPAFALFSITEEPRLIAEVSYADLYIQPRWHQKPGREFGGGVLASAHLATPYVQFGSTRPSGSSWYTTQGIILSFDRDDRMVLWTPAISWRDVSSTGRTAVNFTASGMYGDVDGRTEWLVQFAITAELGLARNK